MPKARTPCARPYSHGGWCRTAQGIRRGYDQNMANRRATVARNRRRIDAYKLAKGCIDCGYRVNPVALDLDHRDPAVKVADVSGLMWATWDKIVAELNKCDVRCACCHRIKTYWQRRRPAEQAP